MEIDEIVRNAIETITLTDEEKADVKVFCQELSSLLRVVDGNPDEEIEKAERFIGLGLTDKQKKEIRSRYEKPFKYDEEKRRTMNGYANVLDNIKEAL